MRCGKCGGIIPNGIYRCTECNAFGDFMSEKQERDYNRALFLKRLKSGYILISIILFIIKNIKKLKSK